MTSSLAVLMMVLGNTLPAPVLSAIAPHLDAASTALTTHATEVVTALPFGKLLPGVLPFFGFIKLLVLLGVLAAVAVVVIVAIGAVTYFLAPKCSVSGSNGACRAG